MLASGKSFAFQGDFVQTDGTEYGLKEALFTKGPMTVSVDASPDSFVFYSSGIYNNTECKSDYKGTASSHSPALHFTNGTCCQAGMHVCV